ncbi:MAG: hypothetical protein SOZ62_00440 [Eubacteriales bacterium]|nr:hypothetical protein [Eubacteriales bacterium]
MVFSWINGRILASVNDNVAYTYNADGIRTTKTVNVIKYEFILDGSTVLCMRWGEGENDCEFNFEYGCANSQSDISFKKMKKYEKSK